MKRKLLCILLAVLFLPLVLPRSTAAEPLENMSANFSDMPQADHWSYAAVSAAIKNGLLHGSDGRIFTERNLSRAELAAIVNRAFGADEQADISGFLDLNHTAWYSEDIAKAVQMKTLNGYGGFIRPDDPVTRQEAFLVLARAFKLNDGDTDLLNQFQDSDQVGNWAAPAVSAMVSAGYVNGSGGQLRPLSFITRAEFAQVMHKMVAVYLSAGGEYTEISDGNVVINSPGVILKNVTVTGDLIIGEGVLNGDVTLDGVTVKGRLVVRGGGEHSIRIINNSDVGSIVIGKTSSGGVRVKAEEGCRIEVVYIDDGLDEIILEGVYNSVTVDTDTPLILNNAGVTTLSVSSAGADVTLTGISTVTAANIDQQAEGATVTVGKDSKISRMESAAPKVLIQGDGTVTEATISGSNTSVNTKNTDITVTQGATGVTQNGSAVTPDSGGNGGSGSVIGPISGGVVSVDNADKFINAVNNNAVSSILVTGEFTVDADITLLKPVTISANAALGIGTSTFRVYDTIINNGILATVSVPEHGVEGYMLLCRGETGQIGKIINNGTYINNGRTELDGLTAIENNGTFENAGFVGYIDLIGFDQMDPELEALYEAGRIENVTDCGGRIAGIASTYGPDAIRSALEKSIPGSGDPYYDIISAFGDGVSEFKTDGALTVRTGQKCIIEKDIILTILTGGSLTVAEHGVLDVYGTLNVNGTFVNNGYIVKGIGGIINGTITNQENGKYYTEREINNQDEWTEVLNDPTCFYAEVNGDITISGNVNIGFSLLINEDASVCVSEGSELSISPFADTFISYSNVNILGTLINNGTITINPGAGIEVFEGATLSNNGLIDVYGWLNANYDSLGGTVKFYANLADVARCLWNVLGGLLPENVDEDADYDTFADALADMSDDDVLGRYALTWLLKNEILDETDLHPYDYADGAIIGNLLETFAAAAGKSYEASITGGVCINDAVDKSGSSFDKLIKSFTDALDVSSADAETESDLRRYLALNYINEIHITDSISLSDNLTVTKHVVIDPGKTLTVAGGRNLTVEWREDTPEQAGCTGVLVIDGTLTVPSDGVVINRGEIDLSGTITMNGTFTNMTDEAEHKYESLFFSDGGTLDNNGTFVANGQMALTGANLTNQGTCFTNNGSLTITGGTVTSSAPFHNAGYMKICDLYGKGSVNTVTTLTFGGTLTNNSNWIEYTAAVYSADGFSAAQSAQDVKKLALGDSMPATGLECYNRMDIMADIALTGNHTVSGWDIWVEAEKQWNDALQDPHTLTISADSSLTVVECTLHVNGELINNGTLYLGQEWKNGGLQVWPRGAFTNTGTVSDTYGSAWRMDEYQYHSEGPAELFLYTGIITGYTGAQDIAVVHDWKALQDAAEEKSGLYERIDILGDDCDITLESNLTVSADMYVEWDDGIEIPEGLTLTLSGSHWLNNSGDIWVYGTLNIGPGFTIENMSYIQVNGTVINDSVINNMGNITLIGQGTIQGSGVVVGMPGSSLTGNVGAGTYYRAVDNETQLIEALGSGDPILITDDVTLSGDLALTGNVTVGLKNFREGAILTGAHTLTIENGAVLAVNLRELEISEGGTIVNEGSLTFGENSGLRIKPGGTLTTQSNVYVNGWHDFYDWENQNNYLLGSGEVHCYASERDLVHFLYCCLYDTDNGGPPTGRIYDGAENMESFDEGSELAAIGNNISGFNDLEFDISGQYAYAALYVNDIIGNPIAPQSKLTYAYAKALMSATADMLGADISEFLSNVPDSSAYICINNAIEEHGSDSDLLCKGFLDALTSALAP